VRIYGLLSWYDERQDWLAAAVTSAAKLCDGIVAFDGAYALFPDSLRHPTSGAEQAATILETALAAGMSCTMHIPDGPWLGNEVEKLTAMMNFGVGEPYEDWYFKFDADEFLSDVPPDARERIEAAEEHVIEARMWQRDEGGGPHPMWPIRRMYRVLPGIHHGPAHHMISATVNGEHLWLTDSENPGRRAPALDMPDLRIEHRSQYRLKNRNDRKDWYYRQRDSLGIETEDVWRTSQPQTSGNGQSSLTAPISS
jgi:hypothetical protein